MSIQQLTYLFVFSFLIMVSCRREDYYEGNDIKLTFSEDTLRFDTVFTTLGSATRYIKVYNPLNQPILVDVELKQKQNTFFRINADGIVGPIIKNLEINGKDSIYIFVEVTINPDQPTSISPFVLEDEIEVRSGGKTFTAVLEAWGQNANYITPSNGKGKSFIYQCELGEEIWDDPKPYVIYGILYIDSCKVVLPPGTRVYIHGGVVRDSSSIYNDGLLVFLKNGKLESKGTTDRPVIFQGDRLEKEYEDVKSQWVGLLFWQESTGNILTHTIIKNSIIGLRVDSMARLSMYGCQISNTSGPAVIGRHATIYSENSLFYNNSSYGLQLTYGGNYTFNYCTIGNYEGNSEAVSIDDVHCGDVLCSISGRRYYPLTARFSNCIFAGNDKDEIGIRRAGEGKVSFDYTFTNCAVRIDELLDAENHPDFLDYCNNCIQLKSSDKLFLKHLEDDYRLDTMSVVLGKAKPLPLISMDISGKIRKSVPDIGCYEF